MEIRQCPICKNKRIKLVYQTDRFPYLGFSVLKMEKDRIKDRYSQDDLFSALKIMDCSLCRHAFQTIVPNQKLMNNIYSKFYNYPSPMLSGYAQERENIFMDFFIERVVPLCKKRILKDILEIGCFDGYILNQLNKIGFNACGCDPSKGADIAAHFGIKVYKRYFNSTYFLERRRVFDVVIFRHLIEHVSDPVGFLRDAQKVLKKYGLIIFETPNTEYYLRNGLFEIFGLQHLQHFSVESAGNILKRAHLNLIGFKVTPENIIVVAASKGRRLVVKNSGWKKNIFLFKDRFEKQVAALNRYLRPFIRHNRKIALWGAGGLCGYLFLLYGINPDKISFVVDSDKRKWRMCFIDKDLKIYPPKRLLEDRPDLIIITSMYSKEILKQIEKMKVKSDVITLHPEIRYIKGKD